MNSLGNTLANLLTIAWLLPLLGFVVQILFALRWWGRKSKAAAYLAIFCIGAGFVCSSTAFYLWGEGTDWAVFKPSDHGHVEHAEAGREEHATPDHDDPSTPLTPDSVSVGTSGMAAMR